MEGMLLVMSVRVEGMLFVTPSIATSAMTLHRTEGTLRAARRAAAGRPTRPRNPKPAGGIEMQSLRSCDPRRGMRVHHQRVRNRIDQRRGIETTLGAAHQTDPGMQVIAGAAAHLVPRPLAGNGWNLVRLKRRREMQCSLIAEAGATIAPSAIAARGTRWGNLLRIDFGKESILTHGPSPVCHEAIPNQKWHPFTSTRSQESSWHTMQVE